jgi:hypothetical protein
MPIPDRYALRTCALLLGLAVALACGQGDVAVEPPPLEVAVADAEKAAIPIYLEHVGTTEAVKTVEARACAASSRRCSSRKAPTSRKARCCS